MKFFLLALGWLLLFEKLQGSTLSHERPIRALNTTLRTNFSGTYERKNPCSGSEVEKSSYKATQEFHHHAKDCGWSDYTHKCSVLIRNFLRNIANLISFNDEPSGSFNFYLNTSISQKQRVTGSNKSCESLPTIVIETTDCKIPLNPRFHIPKDRAAENNLAQIRPDQCPSEEEPPSTDFPIQHRSGSQKVLLADRENIASGQWETPQPEEVAVTTQDPSREWFGAENLDAYASPQPELPTAFVPSTASSEIAQPQDLSPAVLYDFPRDTQSTYEPGTKYFKTSLRLTPQTDPENGTIKPRIQYTAANLITDPTYREPVPQSQAENPLPNPGKPSFYSEGPSAAISTLPSEYPTQVPPAAFHPRINQNEPFQVSPTPKPQFPSSRAEAYPETAAAPTREQFPTDSPLPSAQVVNSPSGGFVPGDRPAVNQISGPRFSSPPLRVQPSTAANYEQEVPLTQVTPPLPQPFDVFSESKPPLFSAADRSQPEDTFSESTEDTLIPPPTEGPPIDTFGQAPKPEGSFRGQPMDVDGGQLSLGPPPTADEGTENSFFSAEPETPTFSDQTSNFVNQVNTFLPRNDQFSAQRMPPTFPTRPPYDGGPPSTIFPPRDAFEATGLPLSDSLITSSPRLEEKTVPDFSTPDSYPDQQPTADARPPARFHSPSSASTVEETVTYNQKQSTPEAMGRTPESISVTFGPSLPSPESGPLPVETGRASQPLTNPDRPIALQFQVAPENTEAVTPPIANPNYSSEISEAADFSYNNINNRVQSVPSLRPPLTPDYSLQTEGSPSPQVATPRPYAPVVYPAQTALPPAGMKPSSASEFTTSGPADTIDSNALTTQPTYPTGEPNLQPPSQSLFLAPGPASPDEMATDEFPVGYPNPASPVGLKEPPASDSFVRDDYMATAAPQPFKNDVGFFQPFSGRPDGFRFPTSDNSLTYDSGSVSQFTDSSEQERSSTNFDRSPLITRNFANSSAPYQSWSASIDSERISEGVSPDSTSPVTPPSAVYVRRPNQRSFTSTSIVRIEEQSPVDRIYRPSPELPVTGVPEAAFSQQPLENDMNRRANPADVLGTTVAYTEQNFQTPDESTTPGYAMQLPDYEQIIKSQSHEERNLEGPSRQDSFPGKGNYPDQVEPAFPPLDTPPEYVDATTPADQQYPSQEFRPDRSFVLPVNAVTSLPENEQPPFQNFNSQQPESPEGRPKADETFPSQQLDPFSSDYPAALSLPTPPMQPPYQFTPTTQPPPVQASGKGLAIQKPFEAPKSPFDDNRSLPFDVKLLPAAPQVGSADDVIPTAEPSPKSALPLAEEETLPTFAPQPFDYVPNDDSVSSKPPQVIDGTLSGPRPYPPTALNLPFAEGAANLQEPAIFNREEALPNEFGPNPSTASVADTELALDSSAAPRSQNHQTSRQTTVIEETTTTTIRTPERFPTDSTEVPLLEPSRMPTVFTNIPSRPQSIAAEEITTPRPQFPSPDPLARPSNYADQNGFVPEVSQQIPPIQIPHQQTVSPQTTALIPSPLIMPTAAPETYPNRLLSSYDDRQNLQSAISDAVESRSPQQQPEKQRNSPQVFSSTADESLSQSAAVPQQQYQQHRPQLPNLQRINDGLYDQPSPGYPQFLNGLNPYNRNLPMPPRAPLSDRYIDHRLNHPPNTLPYFPQNPPPFYPQQPYFRNAQLPQPPSSNLPPKSQLISQQVTETSSQSSVFRPQPLYNHNGQLTPPADRPAAVAPEYIHNNHNNPNALMPPFYPPQMGSYNAFPPQDRYYGPLLPPHPLNYNPYQPNFPLYQRMDNAALSGKPSPMNHFVNDRHIIPPRAEYPLPRPNFAAGSGREVELLADRQRFRHQTEDWFPVRPETPSGLPTSHEHPLPGPLLQPQQPHLVIPTQEPQHRTSFPGRYDHSEQLSFDRQNHSQIDTSPAAPPLPGQWNPPPTNFLNPQQNTPLGAPQSHPRPLVPYEITPSNEPGEDSVSYCGRDTPLLCLFDSALKGNMTPPSHIVLISKLPANADGEDRVRVQKIYMGGRPLLDCTWDGGNTLPAALYTPAPSAPPATLTLLTKSHSA